MAKQHEAHLRELQNQSAMSQTEELEKLEQKLAEQEDELAEAQQDAVDANRRAVSFTGLSVK